MPQCQPSCWSPRWEECEEGVMMPHMLREDPLLRKAEASCIPHVASHCARA